MYRPCAAVATPCGPVNCRRGARQEWAAPATGSGERVPPAAAGNRALTARRAAILINASVLLAVPGFASAQGADGAAQGTNSSAKATEGSALAATAGGALGLYAGATLAAVGSLIPCTQTYPGPSCVRWSAVAGGAIGLGGGVLLGAADAERLGDAAIGAGIGFAAGSVAGLLIRSKAERLGWGDVATIGLFGGAVGSAPIGSAIGLLGGGAVGLILWSTVDGLGPPEALGMAVAGLALGGMTEWLVRGIDAQSGGSPQLQVTLPVRVGF